MVVGTDTPERVGLPKDHGTQSPVRVKLHNEKAKVEFSAEDPKRLPKVKGKSRAKGVLAIGDQITVGDRIFIVTGPNQEKQIDESPLPSCPEAKAKKAKQKK